MSDENSDILAHCGNEALWHRVTVALGHRGIGAPWHWGTVALWHRGTVALGHRGIGAPWHCGTVALWHRGTVALGHCGTCSLGKLQFLASLSPTPISPPSPAPN